METLRNFFDLSLEDLTEFLEEKGHKKFRAQQVFRWVYDHGVTNPEEMLNLSKDFRAELPSLISFDIPKLIFNKESTDGTIKLLVEFKDKLSVETVLIPNKDRLTICVSSEVGCNLGCKFCYTGKQKLKRRLTAAEIIGQFVQAKRCLPEGKRITNVVFMGMGEPLDNEKPVFKSVEIMSSDWGLNVSKKRITISTSGLVDKIPLVSASGCRLAVSLNGSDNEVRSEIMPINRKWPIEVLLEACMDHYRATKDKITFEYVLLKGVTDSMEDALKLHRLTRSVPCKINIIPFNEHIGSEYKRPSVQTVERFQNKLIDLGSHVLLRKTMGRDIGAACGQLNSEKNLGV